MMAEGQSVLQPGLDRRADSGEVPRRNAGGVFSWMSPSPSPEVVAGLERAFPEVIQLPTEAIDRESEEWSSFGVIVRPLSRWVPPEAMLREFRRAGLAGRIDSIALAHRTFMVKFELPAARSAALLQPWIVNGQPLAVEPWRPDFVPAEDGLQSALLWLRLPNLPIEYWNEETLHSILSVAGQFVEADVYTKERRRGSFARACVRVDLSKPLRPGARFRAHGTPFWQQFVYEHVDCICSSCGSLHSAGSCSSPLQPGSSAVTPLFGPWMAALRQRKTPPVLRKEGVTSGHAMAEELKGKGIASAQGDQEGWRKPGKVSRRKVVPSSSLPNVAIIHSENVEEVGMCRETVSVPVTDRVEEEAGHSFVPATVHPEAVIINHVVPVTVHPIAETSPGDHLPAAFHAISQTASKGRRKSHPTLNQSEKHGSAESAFLFKAKLSANQSKTPALSQDADPPTLIGSKLPGNGKVAVNPFALVGTDRWAGCPKIREDANPASLKRARSVEVNGIRVSSKVSKGKGRLPSSRKGPSVVTDPLASGLSQGKDDHEKAIIALKDALTDSPAVSRGVGPLLRDHCGVAPMESVQQLESLDQQKCQLSDQVLQGQCPDLEDNADMVMVGAPDGA